MVPISWLRHMHHLQQRNKCVHTSFPHYSPRPPQRNKCAHTSFPPPHYSPRPPHRKQPPPRYPQETESTCTQGPNYTPLVTKDQPTLHRKQPLPRTNTGSNHYQGPTYTPQETTTTSFPYHTVFLRKQSLPPPLPPSPPVPRTSIRKLIATRLLSYPFTGKIPLSLQSL